MICIQFKCSSSPKSTHGVKVTLGIAAAPSSAALEQLKVQHGDLPASGSVVGHSFSPGYSHPPSSVTENFAFTRLPGAGRGGLPWATMPVLLLQFPSAPGFVSLRAERLP